MLERRLPCCYSSIAICHHLFYKLILLINSYMTDVIVFVAVLIDITSLATLVTRLRELPQLMVSTFISLFLPLSLLVVLVATVTIIVAVMSCVRATLLT
jgi:hypothetical protein